jgi:hypothetical protein
MAREMGGHGRGTENPRAPLGVKAISRTRERRPRQLPTDTSHAVFWDFPDKTREYQVDQSSIVPCPPFSFAIFPARPP